MEEQGQRLPNPQWRPFVATVSKSAHKKGKLPDKKDYMASNTGIKQLRLGRAKRTESPAKESEEFQ